MNDKPLTLEQVLSALARTQSQLNARANDLAERGDYGAQYFAEDAERLGEAARLLSSGSPRPPVISGYRNLSDEEILLINEAKALAERCGEFIEKLRALPDSSKPGLGISPRLDQRWVSIGATDLQRGFMAIVRGIAQPTSF